MLRSLSSSSPTRLLLPLMRVPNQGSKRAYYEDIRSDSSSNKALPGTFDVCVIGCGPAGFAAAMRAVDLKKTVCVVEKAKVGGAGLHNGALSSKALWELSRQYQSLTKYLNCFEKPNSRAFQIRGLELDYDRTDEVVWRTIQEKQLHMEKQLQHFNIPLVQGEARFVTPHRIDVLLSNKETMTINAHNFVIATGSKPRDDPNIYTDGHVIMTSDHIQRNLKDFPKSIAIVGAGVVGCEFATIFANFGRTKVHIINRSTRVLPFEDKDISEAVERKLLEKGVEIHHNASVKSLREENFEAHMVLTDRYGKEKKIVTEKALLSIGRVPYTSIPGLTSIGVQLNDKDQFVEKQTRTSIPHIYVVGDATSDVMLVNIAEIEGRFAVNMMFGVPQEPLNYENVAKIMFVDPLAAGIGLNEQEAKAARISHKVAIFKYSLSSRAMIMGETTGFIKLICSNDSESRVLGARAMGPHSSSLIGIISVMIRTGTPIRELSESLKTAYPAVLEGLHECARMMEGNSIWKPEAFPESLVFKEVVFEEKSSVENV